MSDGLITICRCRFCPRGRGVVALDPIALRRRRRSRSRRRPEQMDYLRFDPDRAPAGPCPHLVRLHVQAWWEDRAGQFGGREVGLFHPALTARDPGHALARYLWSVLSHPHDAALRPATPFHFDEGDPDGRVSDRPRHPGWEWGAWGIALYAAAPVRFVEECQFLDARMRVA